MAKKVKFPHPELETIVENPDNKYCADCGQKAPRYIICKLLLLIN